MCFKKQLDTHSEEENKITEYSASEEGGRPCGFGSPNVPQVSVLNQGEAGPRSQLRGHRKYAETSSHSLPCTWAHTHSLTQARAHSFSLLGAVRAPN